VAGGGETRQSLTESSSKIWCSLHLSTKCAIRPCPNVEVVDSLAPGDDVNAYCSECEAVAEHKILTMKGKQPDLVQCAKCEATHPYETHKPTPKGPAPVPDIPDYDKLLKDRDVSQAVTYKLSSQFNEKDVIDHKVFGIGLVTRILDDEKVEVVFPTGVKFLAHDR
jgi:hypothetical protein